MSKPSMTHPGSPKGYSLSDAQIVAAFNEWLAKYQKAPDEFDVSNYKGADYGERCWSALKHFCPTRTPRA